MVGVGWLAAIGGDWRWAAGWLAWWVAAAGGNEKNDRNNLLVGTVW